MNSKARILATGSILRSGAFFANIIVAFFMMPFVIHSLGNRMYGLWIVIGSLLGYYGLFDFGLSSAISRYVSRAISQRDYKEANVVINTSLFLFSIVALLVLVASFIIAFTGSLFMKNIAEVSLFRQIIIILGCSLAIGFPMRVFLGTLISHLRYDLSTSVEISKLLIRTILIIIFLKMGYGILALASITFFVDFFSYFAIFALAKRIAPYLVLSKRLIDRTRLKLLFEYSSFTFIAQIADKVRFSIDDFVIAAFVGLNFVTVYSIASRLIKYFIDFIVNVLGMMAPVFSQYEAKGDYDSIREKFIFMTKLSSWLSLLIGGTLIIFGKAFIERWMGKEYLSAYPLLIILVVPVVFALMQSQSIQLLYGISKHKLFAISNSAEGIANLILSLILVRKFGLIGVALGTAIPMTIVKLFVQPIYTCRIIKLDTRMYYLKLLAPIFIKSSGIFILFWFMFKKFIVPGYLNLLILTSCSFVLFLIVVFFSGLNSIERNYFKKLVFNAA